jgi:hypothetical protein
MLRRDRLPQSSLELNFPAPFTQRSQFALNAALSFYLDRSLKTGGKVESSPIYLFVKTIVFRND